MQLTWLELTDLRLYGSATFHPDPGMNVLVGPNGAGKTTVLESVAYLSTLASFRGVPDASLIRSGASGAIVRGGFAKPAGETRVEVEIPASGRRRVLVNGKRPVRLSEVASLVPVVAFLPDDLDLVKESAGVRRRYLDDLGMALAPGYGAARDDYERALRQRNALLRADGAYSDPVTLEALDQRLTQAAAALWVARRDLADRLAPVLAAAHQGVAGDGAALSLTFHPAWGEEGGGAGDFDAAGAARVLLAELARRRRRELEQRTTTVGPHRDDVGLWLGDRDARTRASQGEQRSVALAMRVASYRMLHDRHGFPPVLLLDDVFSELDLRRTRAVAEMLPVGQVFVTTTRDDEVPVKGRRWDVTGGVLGPVPGGDAGGSHGGGRT